MLHANQHLLADRYPDRPGIRDVAGSPKGGTGIRAILAAHAEHAVPLNLHLSGTLIEALAWHDPGLLGEVADLAREGLVEIVGSAYSQNILPLFAEDVNRRALVEELRLIERWLGVPARDVKTFWVPERVWSTRALAPLLTDASLPNGGYSHVVLDDRIGIPDHPGPGGRRAFDADGAPLADPAVFAPFRITDAPSLTVTPAAQRLAHAVPPETPDQLAEASRILQRFASWRAHGAPVLATYMEDLERPAGIAPWSPRGPERYARFLAECAETAEPVLMGEWLRHNPPATSRTIDDGCFRALAVDFGAGERYEAWARSPQWAPYADCLARAEAAIREAAADGDPALLDLAWKQYLASAYETAWHDTPACVHAATSDVIPAPWARTIARHALAAIPLAHAARWSHAPPAAPVAALVDVDQDGEEEVLLRTRHAAVIITPRHGARVVSALRLDGRGALHVGNPADDWNWLESLNDYMDEPANHPGAFADANHPHDTYTVARLDASPAGATVELVNTTRGPAHGLRKTFTLAPDEATLDVAYALPPLLGPLPVDVGVSPDYLRLLREGILAAEPLQGLPPEARGYRCGDASVTLELVTGFRWATPRQPTFPHGFLLRAETHGAVAIARLRMQ